MRKANSSYFITAVLLTLYGSAQANVATFDDLDKLQAERFYYQAQAAAKAAQRAATSQGDPEAGQTIAPPAGPGVQVTDRLPSLVKINGRKAVISLSDGTSRTVIPGEMLPGGQFQVQSVTLNGVSVRRITDGKSFPLN